MNQVYICVKYTFGILKAFYMLKLKCIIKNSELPLITVVSSYLNSYIRLDAEIKKEEALERTQQKS